MLFVSTQSPPPWSHANLLTAYQSVHTKRSQQNCNLFTSCMWFKPRLPVRSHGSSGVYLTRKCFKGAGSTGIGPQTCVTALRLLVCFVGPLLWDLNMFLYDSEMLNKQANLCTIWWPHSGMHTTCLLGCVAKKYGSTLLYRAVGLLLDFIHRLVWGRQKIPQRFGDSICLRPQVDGAGQTYSSSF
jgi:hypothetical protein